jgi:hypothetical protein
VTLAVISDTNDFRFAGFNPVAEGTLAAEKDGGLEKTRGLDWEGTLVNAVSVGYSCRRPAVNAAR